MANKKIKVDLDLENNKIENLQDPSLDQDAATKKYVDDNAGGSGHLLRLDDTAPTTITDDVYTGGEFYYSGKEASLNFISGNALDGSTRITAKSNISSTDPEAVLIGSNLDYSNSNDFGRIAIGNRAGRSCNARFTTFIGSRAGENASDSGTNSIFMGYFAGNNSTGSQVVVIGNSAGRGTISSSVILGHSAGGNTLGTKANAVIIGQNAISSNTNASSVVAVGQGAGQNATNVSSGVIVGTTAAQSGNVQNGVAVGNSSQQSSTGSGNQSFGYQSARNMTASNCLVLGSGAADGNGLSNQFIISNSNLPNYADRTAALAAITVGNGAVTGNTYLYFNDSNGAIEGVRL
jgi:hypothetical protein